MIRTLLRAPLLAGTSLLMSPILPSAALARPAADPGAAPAPAVPEEEQAGTPAAAGDIVVSARRRNETSQDVPLAITVGGGEALDNTGSFNVGRLQQLTPTLQFYSSNPRNSSVNIRGIGAPLGLTNDGIEQGVGIYVDDVYYSRVASATF